VDPAMFPSKLWSRLTRRVLSDQASGLWNALDVQGSFRLRSAIASHLERFRGMSVDPSCIVVGTGSEYLLDMLVKWFGRSVGYAVEHPGYQKVLKVLETAGAQVSGISVDEAGLSVKALETSAAAIVHVTPSHQFPMGVVMPIRRRGELLRWAKATSDRYVIEDDYDSEFRFAGAPIPSLKRLDDGGRVIYLNSFTKSLAPSLRIAYMVLPEHLAPRFVDRFSYLHCPVPNLEQETLSMFLEEGHFERHVNRMKIAYRGRRDEIIDWIRRTKGLEKATVKGEEAGLHFLLCPNIEATEDELIASALDQGVRLYGLGEFGAKREATKEPTIVIGYSGIDQTRLGDLFLRLEEAWSGFRSI
jgi:GntR family transcriptional regulator/MocR family aminotransferase